MTHKTITLRLPLSIYHRFRRAAEQDHRSLANLIETAALRHLEASDETDETETREILSNPALMRKLRRGHEAAAKGRGRLVG